LSYLILKRFQTRITKGFWLMCYERIAEHDERTILVDKCWSDCKAEWWDNLIDKSWIDSDGEWWDNLIDKLWSDWKVEWWDNFDQHMLKWLESRMTKQFCLTNCEVIGKENDETFLVDKFSKSWKAPWCDSLIDKCWNDWKEE
jgi:hypothetical protein